jgi:hypothetical protein
MFSNSLFEDGKSELVLSNSSVVLSEFGDVAHEFVFILRDELGSRGCGEECGDGESYLHSSID